jgi:hypothetical protein
MLTAYGSSTPPSSLRVRAFSYSMEYDWDHSLDRVMRRVDPPNSSNCRWFSGPPRAALLSVRSQSREPRSGLDSPQRGRMREPATAGCSAGTPPPDRGPSAAVPGATSQSTRPEISAGYQTCSSEERSATFRRAGIYRGTSSRSHGPIGGRPPKSIPAPPGSVLQPCPM